MKLCDICNRNEAKLYCRACGTVYCWECHRRMGSVGMFKGKCGRCGRKEVVQRG